MSVSLWKGADNVRISAGRSVCIPSQHVHESEQTAPHRMNALASDVNSISVTAQTAWICAPIRICAHASPPSCDMPSTPHCSTTRPAIPQRIPPFLECAVWGWNGFLSLSSACQSRAECTDAPDPLRCCICEIRLRSLSVHIVAYTSIACFEHVAVVRSC
jgi:hypothetical protein